MSTTTTRTVDGRVVPTAGRYQIDPTHSSLELIARHLVVTKVRARFTRWDAELVIADDPAASSLSVSIDTTSFDSGNAERDAHVRSVDFLDVESYPTATFTSASIQPSGPSTWTVDGELTIKDTTHPLALEVTFGGGTTDPFGNTKVLFAAEADLDREAWGITWNAPLEAGGLLIGKQVKLEIEVQAVPS